jgi:hypothetical protein
VIPATRQIEIDALTSSIRAYVEQHEDKILSTLMPAGFAFEPKHELDGCGPTAILRELERVLFISIMRVRAVPYRASRKLIAVLEKIASHPDIIKREFSDVDPEAAAIFETEYGKLSQLHRTKLLELHAGLSITLDPTSVTTAARNAIRFLEPHIRRGQPKNLPQQKLALDLGKFYLKRNPTIGRRVTGVGEIGRFKRFVTSVLPLYNQHAKPVGRSARADSIVRRMTDLLNRRSALCEARQRRLAAEDGELPN